MAVTWQRHASMATLLLNLRHVPDDEVAAIRALLDAHGLEFYETPPNRWGISMGAIWLRDDDRAAEARALLAEFQDNRREEARRAHARARAEGRAETFLGRLRRRPLDALGRLALAAGILYLTLGPFLGWL